MPTTRSARLSRVIAGVVTVLGLSFASLVAIAPAAQASGTGATCPVGRFCLYFNSDQKGARADLLVTDAALNNELFDDGPVGANGWKVLVGNNAASYWNRTDKEIILYDGANCSYGAAKIASGAEPGAKRNLPSYLKNRVSSMKLVINGNWRSGCSTNVDQSKY